MWRYSGPLFIGSDHAGFQLKNFIINFFSATLDMRDCGILNDSACDYPIIAKNVIMEILKIPSSFGILICGSGVGMSIAANRFSNIRAALCNSCEIVQYARKHNDANVLVLGARMIDQFVALDCVKQFISTEFDGGRHIRRVKMLETIV